MLAKPDSPGRLVVLTGLPGSGKTTLAVELAASMSARRMCPDDWIMAAGIDLWDAAARAQIENFQLSSASQLLSAGQNVIIEWGTWTRAERDALRDSARAVGASVELRWLSASLDELWRRISARDMEGRWSARPIERHELEQWAQVYEAPDDDELATYDDHACVSGTGAAPGGGVHAHGTARGRDAVGAAAAAVVTRPRPPLFVLVTGPPASGKSTLAPPLAAALGLPLVAKDTIKDALMSALPVPDVEASRQLGRAAVKAMLAVAAASPIGAVIESNFYRSAAREELNQLPGAVVEVFCRCHPALAAERYRARAGTRHAGHFDTVRRPDELWNDEVGEPVAGGWPVFEVDTTVVVDLAEVLALVRRSGGTR